MKFCTKCGTPIEEGVKFCTSCGNPVSAGNENIPPQNELAQPAQNYEGYNAPPVNTSGSMPKLNIKLTKTQKIIALAAAAVLILAIVGYNVGASLTSRDKAVTNFTQALASKNTSQLAKYIVSSDPNVKIDSKSLEALMTYIDKNASYKDVIAKSLSNQSATMNSSKKDVSVLSKNTNDLFTLKKQGKTWLFYDKYVFEINPVYVNVQTNYKDTKIYLNDSLVCTSDKNDFTKTVGPFIPGMYKLKGELANDYAKLDKSMDLDLVNMPPASSGKKTKPVSLTLDGYIVSVDSDFKDAKVFANGKDTGLTVKDASKFGPVPRDGSVKLNVQMDFPWGTVKGEQVALTGNSYYFLKLSAVNDDVQNSVMDTINNYNKDWLEAIKARDASKLTGLTPSKLDNDKQYIQRFIDNKELYTGTLNKTVFDLDSFRINQKDGKYYCLVIDEETYNSATYNEGSPAPQLSPNTVSWTYTLVYDDTSKKWLIDNLSNHYYFYSDNKKEFTF